MPVLYLYGVSIHLMLLFINKTGGVSCTLYRVSIHLMLLFIQKTWFIWDRTLSFNTSHVTLYLSNHAGPKSSIALFQYISCYSLSWSFSSPFGSSQGFNTSHVTLYQCCYVRNLSYTLRFNTSHVTLYLNGSYSDNSSNVVSIHLMLLFIRQPGFSPGLSFHVSIHLMLLFICMAYRLTGQKTCFNTSHVTLYQINTKSQDALLKCFNTSHVTLYQKRVRTCKKLVSVSIHLMLLFIQVDVLQPIGNQCFNTSHVTLYQLKEKTYYQLRKFQYISCYSLSLVL